MDNEEAKEMIMDEFLKDYTMYFTSGGKCYSFDEILSQSLRQYTPDCWKSIIVTSDWGEIRLVEYVLNEGKFEKNEIRLNQQDIEALTIALNVHKAA